MAHPGTIKSVENAISILEFLREEDEASMQMVSDHVGLSKSTTHYYLSTLCSSHIITRTDNGYRLGYKLLEYGGFIKSQSKLYNHAKPHMDRIALETDLAVYLGIEEEQQIVHIASISIESTSIIGDHDGKLTKFHSSALGKVILAHLPDHRRRNLISNLDYPKFTDQTITDPDQLESHLDTVAQQGYAINDEEDFRGWKGIAVPILSTSAVVGSLSVAGPKSKIDHKEEKIIRLLSEAKDEIELEHNVDG
jgi:DNA-binding IclR family transcriptional regulator